MVYSLPLAIELAVLSVAALLPARRPCLQANLRNIHLAVVIPAHNEAKMIAACVRSILAAGDSYVTPYVVAHNCSDQTAEVARAAGAHVLVLNDASGGKGLALDCGFQHALAQGADAVLVVDADSEISVNMTTAVRERMAGGAGALQCRYQAGNTAASTRTQLAGLALVGMNVVRPRGRDRLGLSCGIFGNGFALSAATLQRVPYTANSLVEDLEYHLHLIRAGIRVEFVDEATVLGEMPTGGAAAGTQRARWEGGRLLMRRTWSGPLLAEVLRGRVALLEPLLDLLAVPLATEVMVVSAVMILGLLVGMTGGAWWLAIAATVVFLVMTLYVLAAALLGPNTGASLGALASVPGYLAWKIVMIPKTRLAARRDAAWVRTRRNAEESQP